MKKQATPSALAARKKAFDKVQEIVSEQAPFAYLVHPNVLVAVSDSVSNAAPRILPPPGLECRVSAFDRRFSGTDVSATTHPTLCDRAWVTTRRRGRSSEASKSRCGQGRSLGRVGESGSGRVPSPLAILGLLRHTGADDSRRHRSERDHVATYTEAQMRDVRGRMVSLIPQGASGALIPRFGSVRRFGKRGMRTRKSGRRRGARIGIAQHPADCLRTRISTAFPGPDQCWPGATRPHRDVAFAPPWLCSSQTSHKRA